MSGMHRVGFTNTISISDIGNKVEENAVRAYDRDNDQNLSISEAMSYYADKTGGMALQNMGDLLKLLGGKQHQITTYYYSHYGLINMPTSRFKGDFTVNNADGSKTLGAGNVRAERVNYNGRDSYNIMVDCNLMNRHYLENNLEEAVLIIGPADENGQFAKEEGSDLAEKVVVPFFSATQPEQTKTYSRGGGSVQIPDIKHLGLSIKTEDLQQLMGDSKELCFYIRMTDKDGSQHWINPEGRSEKLFTIDKSELIALDDN